MRDVWQGGAGLLVLGAAVLLFSSAGIAAGSVEIDSVDMPSSAEPGDTVNVEVTATNGMDREADDLEIRVEGLGQLKDRTLHNIDPDETVDIDETLNVPDDADGTEEVRVEVQARDDDGTILSDDDVTRTITIDDGDAPSTSTDVEIVQVATPSRVQAGTEIGVDITVENRGSSRTHVDLRMEAFGQVKTLENVRIDGGEERTSTLNLTVPRDASGPADLDIEADTGGERDLKTVTVRVASLSMTMQLSPDEAEVGEPVTISGMMSAAGVEADLYVGGLYEATIRSDETAHYTHTVTPERPGSYRVLLRAGPVTTEKILHVVGAVTVNAVAAPDTAASGTLFTVCSRVSRSSPGTADVALLVDGEVIETASTAVDDRTEVCFDTSIDGTGDRTVTVRASADGAQDSRERTVSVVEAGVTADVVPRQLTLQPGQAGVMRVDIQNDELEERTFTVTLDGMVNVTVQREHEVTLGPGGSDTVILRMVPQGSGTRNGTVTVATGGTTVMAQDVGLTAARNPALRHPVVGTAEEWAGAARDRFARLPQDQQWIVLGAGVLLVIGTLWLWRRGRHDVMQPQY